VGHDPSALATWGTDGISKFVLDYWSSQVEYSDVKSHAVTQWRKWRPRMLYVEDATWAQPLISDLRRESGVRVHAVPTRGNKWTRADAISPEFEGGSVVLPEDAPWLPDWLHDHIAFPAAQHDEAVDTTSLMLSQMRNQPSRTRMVRLNDKGAVDSVASVEKMRLRMKEFLRG
jgi:predicted phage terminase large subunit-like protein